MVMMTKGIAVALMLPCDSHLCEPSCSAPVLRWPGSVIRESAGRAGTEQEVRSVSYRLHTLLAVGRVARAARPPGGGGYFYTADEGETEANKCVIGRRLR